MRLELHPKAALLSAARAAELPLAFLVGSPLSQDSGGGVPGVPEMLAIIRDEVMSRASSEVARFEEDIRGASGAEAYQRAMKWLQANLTQDAVNHVVGRAVKLTRKPGAPVVFREDGDAADWYIPKGTKELAHLITHGGEHFAGPILTTNFDPLLPLAVRDAGGRVSLRVVDSDGYVGRRVETSPDVVEIVYLHGYWRDADTLHTARQLTNSRPRLKASLNNILRQRTVLVSAYSGWDDVFTTALAEILDSDDAVFNVLWCFHERDVTSIETKYSTLLQRVERAVTRGRFLTYCGIDCHSIFGELATISGLVPRLSPIPTEEPPRTTSTSQNSTEFPHETPNGGLQFSLLDRGRASREEVRTWIDRLVRSAQRGATRTVIALLNEEIAESPEFLTIRTRAELIARLCNLNPAEVRSFADLLLEISADVKERKWLRVWDAYMASTHTLNQRYRDFDVMRQLTAPVKRWIEDAPDPVTRSIRIHTFTVSDLVSRQPLHLIWIVDCSGSMTGSKIETVNRAIRETLPDFREVAQENPQIDLLVRVVIFSSGARWHVQDPTPIIDFHWNDMVASGQTDAGAALKLVAEQLQYTSMNVQALPPVLVLLLDGHPTDDFDTALQLLNESAWGKKSARVGLAIGEDADMVCLERFAGRPHRALIAYNPDQLVSHVRWVTTSVIELSRHSGNKTIWTH